MRPKVDRKLLNAAEQIIDLAKKHGAAQCAASVTKSNNNRVVCRDGSWEEIKGATTLSLSVRIIVDGKYASHTTSDLRAASVEQFIKEAVSLTRYLTKDPHRVLPEKSLFAGRSSADLHLYDSEVQKLDLARRKAFAQKAYEAARARGGVHLISCAGAFGDTTSEHILITSRGFEDYETTTSFFNYATVNLKDPAGGRPSEYEVTGARSLGALVDPAVIGTKAAERTVARLGAKKIPSTQLPVIIENRAVRSLLRGFLRPLSGRNVYNRQSCFGTRSGASVAAPLLDIYSDPLLPGGLGSGRFDSEGIAARKLEILTKGTLRSFFIDSYYGSKLKMKPTTGNHFNIVLRQGTQSLAQLASGLKKGILITAFNGGNSNATSGDFSHGIKGFLVENGVITTPVKELNIAGNHTSFWNNVEGIGSDPYLPSSMRTPSLRFKPLLIAGT